MEATSIEMKELDQLIWMAGYFDADGHCTLQTTKSTSNNYIYRNAYVTVSSKNPNTLLPFTRRWGGKIRCYSINVPCWCLTGKRALKFLQAVAPYLVCKKERATLIIEYYNVRGKLNLANVAEELYKEMRVYNAARTEYLGTWEDWLIENNDTQ